MANPNHGRGGSGGGIFASNLVLTNSTVENNGAGDSVNGGAGGSGGGLSIGGPSTLTNDTLADNAAGSGSTNGTGGAIKVIGSSPVSLANTILASNSVGGNCAGPIIDAGHNLSFDGAGCPAGFATGDPSLGPLQDNGGPTLTMAILLSSAALDQVPPAAGCPATDQRGNARPQGSACDIGAFELAVVARYGLSVSKAGTGSGTVTSSPAGIDCGPSCNAQFDSGTSITLTATPASGSSFAGWSGGGCSGSASCTFVIGADTTVTASFKAKPPPVQNPPNTKISKAKIDSGAGTASFTFKATGGSKAKAATSGFRCALVKKHGKANARFKLCSSPKRYKDLKKGKYTFEVRAFDGAGKDPSPATRKFKIK